MPGLVEKGYVSTELRTSRSNVFRLNFDRWTGQKGGDTGATVSCLDGGDTGAMEGATLVPSHYKEQQQVNNSHPQPPRQARGRVTRSEKLILSEIEAEQAWMLRESKAYRYGKQELNQWTRNPTSEFARSGELLNASTHCSGCSGALNAEAPATEVYSQNGLRHFEAPFLWDIEVEEIQTDGATRDPSTWIAAQDYLNGLGRQLSQIFGNSNWRYWLEDLAPISLHDKVLCLAAPDLSHLEHVSRMLEEHCNALDAASIMIRVDVMSHTESRNVRKVWHRECQEKS